MVPIIEEGVNSLADLFFICLPKSLRKSRSSENAQANRAARIAAGVPNAAIAGQRNGYFALRNRPRGLTMLNGVFANICKHFGRQKYFLFTC